MTARTRQRWLTIANVVAVIGILSGGFAFFLKYNDRLLLVEAAQVYEHKADQESDRRIERRLDEIATDMKELRREIKEAAGVRWSELPPSPYRGR